MVIFEYHNTNTKIVNGEYCFDSRSEQLLWISNYVILL